MSSIHKVYRNLAWKHSYWYLSKWDSFSLITNTWMDWRNENIITGKSFVLWRPFAVFSFMCPGSPLQPRNPKFLLVGPSNIKTYLWMTEKESSVCDHTVALLKFNTTYSLIKLEQNCHFLAPSRDCMTHDQVLQSFSMWSQILLHKNNKIKLHLILYCSISYQEPGSDSCVL